MQNSNKQNVVANVAKRYIDKAKIWKGETSHSTSVGSQLVFITEGNPKGVALREKPTPEDNLALWSMGHPEECAPSHVFGRMKWEIQLFFSLHNVSKNPLSVYDFHAHVYEISGIKMPLAMMIHRARIELCQDNSIFSTNTALHIGPGEVQHVKLVFETSLYDTLMTTILFGIFTDYHLVQNGDVYRYRLPSDKIYIFQHWHQWRDTKCHIVARDEVDIKRRLAENPKDKELKQFCGVMQKYYKEHITLCREHLSLPLKDMPEAKRCESCQTTQSSKLDKNQHVPFDLSVIDKKFSSAGNLLRILVFLGNYQIPKLLLYEAFYQLSLEQYDTLDQNSKLYMKIAHMKDGSRFRDQTITYLIQEGFLYTMSENAFQLHPCLNESILQTMTMESQCHWLKYAISSIDAMIPNPNRFKEKWYRQLAPLAQSCLNYLERLAVSTKQVIDFCMNLHDCLCKIQLLSEAEIYSKYALDNISKVREANPMIIAHIKISYSEALRLQGKYEGVENILMEARDSLLSCEGDNSFNYAISLHNLGALYRDTGKTSEAENLFKKSFDIFQKCLKPTSPFFPEILEDHAKLYIMTKRSSEAKIALDRATLIRQSYVDEEECDDERYL